MEKMCTGASAMLNFGTNAYRYTQEVFFTIPVPRPDFPGGRDQDWWDV